MPKGATKCCPACHKPVTQDILIDIPIKPTLKIKCPNAECQHRLKILIELIPKIRIIDIEKE